MKDFDVEFKEWWEVATRVLSKGVGEESNPT